MLGIRAIRGGRLLVDRSERGDRVGECHRLDAFAHREGLAPGVYHQLACDLQIGAAQVKASR